MRLGSAVGVVLSLVGIALVAAGPLGAETICDVQAYNPADGLSPLNGRTLTLSGIVTVPSGIFQPTRTSIYIRGLGDDDCGINVYSTLAIQGINLGDTVVVRGQVQEYVTTSGNGATTEIVFTSATDISVKPGTAAPEPEFFSTGQVGREANEGKLVRVAGKLVTAVLGRSFSVDDGSGAIEIYDLGQNFSADSTWRSLQFGSEVTVTGVLSQSDPDLPYLSGYSINPRHPRFGDVSTAQCGGIDTPSATLKVGEFDRYIFSPEYGEKIKIAYNCPNGARVRLRIFDAYGRCVATLDDRISVCGATEFSWDGRDEIEELLPCGLYHVVVTATDPRTGGESQQTAPVVIGRRLE